MFLVDANILIEAKNRYYGFDIAPGFWKWLENLHADGLACSIDAVRAELCAGSDELSDWARDNASFFLPLDAAAVAQFAPLTAWASAQSFLPAALAAFAGNAADYQLVAYAAAHGHTMVTHEQSNPARRNRVMIPDACTAVGVTSIGTFEMMRRTGAKLDLTS
ncbi:DUF4411 family protein [Rhodococcus baikonurensis]|uniref:DUF4411 family protein n=1 Tax=Rhodococcus baikonurensis TaxID=172041 RepID=A0ABV5XEI9_9NOCA